MSAMSQEWARHYIGLGYSPIPVPSGEKNPGRPGWESLRITEDVPSYWTDGQNVGLLCGEPSGWCVDVDLDTDEAVKVAFRFLPPTLTGGRESRPHSHCWYVAPGAESVDWKDVDGKKLVELRSTGRQTLVEPSTHPDGDGYVWHSESGLKMAEVPASELRERCRGARDRRANRPPRPTGGQPPRLRDGPRRVRAAGRTHRGGSRAQGLQSGLARGRSRQQGSVARPRGHRLGTAENLGAGELVVGGPTLEEHAPGVVRLLCRWWGWNRHDYSAGEGADVEERKPTQAELLVRCAGDADLFHTPAGDCYATVPVSGHWETHPVKAKGFRRWFVRAYFERYDRPPGNQALQDALGLLEARAEFDGPEREVHVRVAGHAGNIYLDLANEDWQVVEITPSGWRVLPGEDTPARFRRPRGMLALPTPLPANDGNDGCDGLLRRFFNVSGEEDLRLIVAWLVAALRPTGPYPVLLFRGEQGSAKSTAERLVRALAILRRRRSGRRPEASTTCSSRRTTPTSSPWTTLARLRPGSPMPCAGSLRAGAFPPARSTRTARRSSSTA